MTQALVKYALKIAFLEKEKRDMAATNNRNMINKDGRISVDQLSPQSRVRHQGANHKDSRTNLGFLHPKDVHIGTTLM